MSKLSSLLFGLLLSLPALALADDYFQVIPVAEVAGIMHKPGVAILDVNVPEVWAKNHIPGAVHIDSEDLAKFLPADKKSTLIFYCASPLCSASAAAANESVMLGFRHVYVMPEGIVGWVKLGYPVVSEPGQKGAGMDMKPCMDMKPGMDMKTGMDMKPGMDMKTGMEKKPGSM
jgi:rhodanese-related sulfurtransferase